MEMSEERKTVFSESFMGGLIAALIATALVLIVAVVCKYVIISDTLIRVINVAIKGIAVVIGVFTQIKTGEKGLVKGLIAGLVFGVINVALFISLGGGFDIPIVFIDLGIGMVTGSMAGVLAVNTKKFDR